LPRNHTYQIHAFQQTPYVVFIGLSTRDITLIRSPG